VKIWHGSVGTAEGNAMQDNTKCEQENNLRATHSC